jgi:hypothetical protein
MKRAKLADVLSLFSTYRKTNNIKILDKAIKLSTEICVSPLYPEDEKITTLREILAQAALEENMEIENKKKNKLSDKPEPEPELEVRSVNLRNTCNEFICRWRDSLLFLLNTDADTMISLLRRVVKLQELPVVDRIYTAVHFYNACQYHVCYPCFTDLAMDTHLPLEHRLESTKFLFASGEDEEREIAKKVLLEIIGEHKYECSLRYGAIRSYIPNTGIRTMMNIQKLMIPYEEEFVSVLQKSFFNDEKNDARFRILSGQHLLQMKTSTSNDDKRNIVNTLFSIGANESNTENARADALDVILRLGNDEEKIKAKLTLSSIGKKSSKDAFKTIYNNSQNIHDETISESILAYLEKIVEVPKSYKTYTFDETLKGVTQYIREIMPISSNNDEYVSKRHAINNALSRIKIDTATFTKYNITTVEVMCHVWSRINSCEFDDNNTANIGNNIIALLKQRLVDELLDMDDTCSSGAGRFVNVFSSFDDTIKISWKEQITANVKGRIDAKIRNCENADLQATLTFGMMDDADESDREVYVKFILDNIESIEKELYVEFVKEGHISDVEFEGYMKDIRGKFCI